MRKGLIQRLSAWRHGRGFGVHSPLAFELISTVLRDRPAYYGDAEIARCLDRRRDRRLARILLRLAARFQPETVCVPRSFRFVLDSPAYNVVHIDDPAEADLEMIETGRGYKIRVGVEDDKNGPITLRNDRDLEIVVYRHGLSPTLIHTTL